MEFSYCFHSDNGWRKENRWSAIDGDGDVAWTYDKGDININIDELLKRTKRYNISIDCFFALCISHELIHNIITRDINWKTSGLFDNICHKINRDFKTWFGGIG